MNELKERELLKYLDDMRKLWKMERLPLIDYNPKVEEQAYQQIKERLQQSVPIKLYEDFEFDSVLDKILERVARDLHYGTEDAMIDIKKLFRSLIQKPEVTEEWYEEKAKELCEQNYVNNEAKDFLRKLVKELPAKKPTVPKAFVEKWNQIIAKRVNVQMKKDFIREEISLVYPGTENLIQMFKMAEIEVVKKPTVTKAFVENMTSRMEQMMMQTQKREDREYFIRCEVLRAAGVEEE